MITKTLKIGIFIFTIASFSYVGAQEKTDITKDKSARMFKHLDADGDNKITLEEFKAKTMKDVSKKVQVENRFKQMDTNESGFVDRAEFKAFMEGSNEKNHQVKANKTVKKKG